MRGRVMGMRMLAIWGQGRNYFGLHRGGMRAFRKASRAK
jgi:hypothetical protein